MVYFPGETISFSPSTVLSSAHFSVRVPSAFSSPLSLSRALMLLPAPLDPISAPWCREDGATLLTQNGFSPFGGLTPRFFLEPLRSQTSSASAALVAGLGRDAALWLDAQEDVFSPVNIVIG